MSSNNPFASALNEDEGYVGRRAAPAIPRLGRSITQSGPPAKEQVPPPAYEEVADPEKVKADYPREKERGLTSRTHRSSRPHRSHSDSARHRTKSSGYDRERRRHHKSSRNKSPSKKLPEPVKSKNMDTIDKLDVSGFFGGGFHHDGPFDACTPHRNKNVKAAPVMAFPADGPNNTISGMTGSSKTDQLNKAFGNFDDNDQNEIVGRRISVRRAKSADNDVPVVKTSKSSNDPLSTYNTMKANPSVINFDSKLKAEPIHGSTTAGLGSSTFVDGAPAPKPVADEYLSVPGGGGGLGRKKSLVQRLRNSHSENSSRRSSSEANEGRRGSFGLEDDADNNAGSSLLRRVKSLKVRR
ncbi:uncharacterized protein PRCAT00002385001 [Priceomyces carsonii]|uniref:uncharacterized protein n=1 Tax=Priceomyces carsonii TaxID=28549 RepID=UPI002EDAEE0D|nr:unnamed protein product [Priceomyces carsonii]